MLSGVNHYSWRIMSNTNVERLIAEISKEISRDGNGWCFTQAATSRICEMDHKTIRQGLQVDAPSWGSGFLTSKMTKSLAAQGISARGLNEFRQQWLSGRVSDLMVSCLITYAATQKNGPRSEAVIALHGVMAAAGLRSLLDSAFGVEDVKGRVFARLDGIDWRVKYTEGLAKEHRNIGAYTAAITGGITGHVPKTWNEKLLPGEFGEGAGRLRDHADETTLALIRSVEKEVVEGNLTGSPQQFARYARDIAESAKRNLGYAGVGLSPAKLTPRVTRQIKEGKRRSFANSSTGEMPLLKGNDKT